MLGIQKIAHYLPDTKSWNAEKKECFDIDDDFIENKIGVQCRTVKNEDDNTSDLCVKAYHELLKKIPVAENEIECCVVVTQNPDYNIPHTSAIVHGKIGLSDNCACYDLSLGCSGYVYGLSNIIAFMQMNGMKRGLLFTADPYSKIIDMQDKNTALLFGDGATVTLISDEYEWKPVTFSFGTNGSNYRELICDDTLYMNGRAVFNFTATTVPKHIKEMMEQKHLNDADIDKYILHQGSKYIVDTIRKRLGVDAHKVPFHMFEYGNTVSSSIPMILEEELDKPENSRMVLSGFGVGLSWASAIIEKK